jgi:chorismate dehydratase
VSRRLRVGIVDYLNSRPLAWSFLRGELENGYEPVYETPARVADLLAAGRLDIGLIPSIEYARIPDLRVIPGPCVASERQVRSVLLVSTVPFDAIRTLALDVNSRTSATLVGILLAEVYGVEPRMAAARPRLAEMLAANDAALIIGDPALEIGFAQPLVLDLASAWHDLTGLPFVFALWAVRREAVRPGLAADFRVSLERGLEHLPQLADEAAARLALDRTLLLDYLRHSLTFELGEREAAGLEEFYRRAAPVAGTDPDVRLRFVDGAGERES